MVIALLANPTWQMKGSRVNEVAVAVDAGEPEVFPTKVVDPTAVAVALPRDLIPGLQDGARVTFQFDRAKYTFPLNYTRQGLGALQRCYQSTTETASTDRPSEQPEGKRAGASSGSGMFVSRDGAVLTNAHVVEDCPAPIITTSDKTMRVGSVVARDATNDLALIRTPLSAPEVAAFRIGAPKRGEEIRVFGYPLPDMLANSGSFTNGIVSNALGPKGDSRYMQITAPIQPGNSGGPAFDMAGNLIGVVTAKLNDLEVMVATRGSLPQNVNFALKASIARTFLEGSGVVVETGSNEKVLDSAAIEHRADRTTVFVECRG